MVVYISTDSRKIQSSELLNFPCARSAARALCYCTLFSGSFHLSLTHTDVTNLCFKPTDVTNLITDVTNLLVLCAAPKCARSAEVVRAVGVPRPPSLPLAGRARHESTGRWSRSCRSSAKANCTSATSVRSRPRRKPRGRRRRACTLFCGLPAFARPPLSVREGVDEERNRRALPARYR